MNFKIILGLASFSFAWSIYAGPQAFYCPQRHGYINIGMSAEQVVAACGEPLSRQDANNPITVKVPVKQLIYNNQGTDMPFSWYRNYWAPLKTGFGGVQMEMDIVDYKVKLIRINSSNSNASSVCNGVNIRIGDSQAKVFNACGAPSVVNNSYINQIITPLTKPQLWIYQPGQFEPPFTLMIVDGKLQNINIQTGVYSNVYINRDS